MKLRTKLSLLIIGLVAVIVLLTSVLLLTFEKDYLLKQEKENQVVLIEGLVRVSKEAVFSRDIIYLLNYVKTLKNSRQTIEYAMFLDENNRILAHTNPMLLREFSKDPISTAALESKGLLLQSYKMQSGPGIVTIIDVSLPVFLGDKRIGTARIGFCKDKIDKRINQTLNKIRQHIIIIDLIVSVFSLLCIFVITHMIIRPVKMLAKGAELISQGQLDTKINLLNKDEFGWLAEKFNEMAEKLKELDEMKRDFVSGVTHELRSPLGAIETYVNRMLDGGIEGFKKTGIDDLNTMKNNIVRLSRFINDLLDTAKIESAKLEIEPRLTDLPEIIKDVVVLFGPRAKEKNISINTEYYEKLPKVFVDGEKIRQVFINLVSNSLKFTPSGGRIIISAMKPEGNAGFIEVKVTDAGIGVPGNELNKMFDRFHQVKGTRKQVEGAKGTGLGLYIVKNIIELHGGKISVKSPPYPGGKGTSFILTLPVKEC